MVLLESAAKKLKAGDLAPDFSLRGTDGKVHSLSAYRGARALLVVFMCNHCPYVKAKFGRLGQIHSRYSRLGVRMAGINSNDPENYPEDSFEAMKALALGQGWKFDYLFDESQETARKYGAVCTPDPFLFDSDFKLVFHSRIDYPPGLDAAQKHELHDAIGEFLEKGSISI